MRLQISIRKPMFLCISQRISRTETLGIFLSFTSDCFQLEYLDLSIYDLDWVFLTSNDLRMSFWMLYRAIHNRLIEKSRKRYSFRQILRLWSVRQISDSWEEWFDEKFDKNTVRGKMFSPLCEYSRCSTFCICRSYITVVSIDIAPRSDIILLVTNNHRKHTQKGRRNESNAWRRWW